MDKMRQDFEDAYEQKYGSRPRLWDDRMNAYRDAHSNGAYWGWKAATLKAFGDGHRAGFESGMKATHEFDEARIDRIASSHGDGEHYGELK